MPDYYSRYCAKCEGKIVLHAFSEGQCEVCGIDIQTSHTPCDKVCRDCSIEKNLCMSCGGPLGWVPQVWHGEKHGDDFYLEVMMPPTLEEKRASDPFSTFEELTAKEIIERYDHLLNDDQREMLKKYLSSDD